MMDDSADSSQPTTEREAKVGDLRRLAAIVEWSNDPIIGKDIDGTITSWNPAAERLYGYTAEEAIGQSIRIIVPKDRDHEEDETLARVRRGEQISNFETARLTKDGRLVEVSLTISPIRDSTGTIIGASKIARDLTPLRLCGRPGAAGARAYRRSSGRECPA